MEQILDKLHGIVVSRMNYNAGHGIYICDHATFMTVCRKFEEEIYVPEFNGLKEVKENFIKNSANRPSENAYVFTTLEIERIIQACIE